MTSLFTPSEIKIKKEPTGDEKTKPCAQQIEHKTKIDVRLGKRFQNVAQVIGKIKMGTSTHYASMGQWSNHELLLHILDQTGPAELFFCTWSVSENAIRQILIYFDEKIITDVLAVLDWRVKAYRPAVFALMQYNFPKLRLTHCHGKVFVVKNKNWAVSVVGSANFTNNPRIEAGVISCDPVVAQFHQDWITAEYKNAHPFQENKKQKESQKK